MFSVQIGNDTVRAAGAKVPVVFSVDEVRVGCRNERHKLLIAELLYGSGLRLMELPASV
jgi:hypothetical protein